jgi:flagellar biosynthetic protein FliP
MLTALSGLTYAQERLPFPFPNLNIGVREAQSPRDVAVTLEILFILTIITLAPAILVMMTSFTRIVIVLSFIRQALGTQQIPSNQIIIGLALFMTFFIMAPIGKEINDKALQPYLSGQIDRKTAFDEAITPLRRFMFSQTREGDIELFMHFSGRQTPVRGPEEISTLTLIPAFVVSELKTAFMMALFIYIPFLIIDMVVASTLMSMGMLMLPPVMISLPFKILLFIAVDGWQMIVGSLLQSFGTY